MLFDNLWIDRDYAYNTVMWVSEVKSITVYGTVAQFMYLQ